MIYNMKIIAQRIAFECKIYTRFEVHRANLFNIYHKSMRFPSIHTINAGYYSPNWKWGFKNVVNRKNLTFFESNGVAYTTFRPCALIWFHREWNRKRTHFAFIAATNGNYYRPISMAHKNISFHYDLMNSLNSICFDLMISFSKQTDSRTQITTKHSKQ